MGNEQLTLGNKYPMTQPTDIKMEENEDETIQSTEELVQKITRIEEIIQSEELDSYYGGIHSMIETNDKRIASGGEDGNISISSYSLNQKKWKRDIHKKKAHNACVNSLCTLNGNRILSGSDDHTIKLWAIFAINMTQIKVINEHTDRVFQVIPLSLHRFASCSFDKTVRIWQDDNDNAYNCITTLEHNDSVFSILQLKGKEELVSCGYTSIGISFWDINNYTQQHTVKGYGAFWPTHMIELSDGNIALSANVRDFPIVIIDTTTYQIVTVIKLKEDIISNSPFCVFNEHSFIYFYNGTFLQISNDDYSIVFKSKRENFDGDYYGGVITIKGGRYLAVQNRKRISIVKPCGD